MTRFGDALCKNIYIYYLLYVVFNLTIKWLPHDKEYVVPMTIVSKTMVSHVLSTQFVVYKNGNNDPAIYLHVLTILMNIKCL